MNETTGSFLLVLMCEKLLPHDRHGDQRPYHNHQGRRKGGGGGALGACAPSTFKVMRKSALFKKESALFAWLTVTLVCPSERYEIEAE